MTKYVIGVSGGVDSVVLLHMLVNGNVPNTTYQIPPTNLVVAHFDHGIRSDSAQDGEFVRKLAGQYNLVFETRREELGKTASEELARNRRYGFLRDVAKKYDAKILTAHHANDIVETIAINLTRGTGWRGLAVLDSPDIERPLLDTTKTELIIYAKQHELSWREDSTNSEMKYLRNNLRQKLENIENDSHQLSRLYRDRQVVLKRMIDDETKKLIGDGPYKRHLFISMPASIACELLRAVFIREVGVSPARPQLHRALHAIKVLQSGKRYEVMSGTVLQFTQTHYVVERTPKVVS